MIIERRITFYCRDDGLPSYLARELRRLSNYVSSQVALVNLTQLQVADIASPLAVISLACKPGDLCQLLIEGLDAELGHLILTDYVAEHFPLVIRGGNKSAKGVDELQPCLSPSLIHFTPQQVQFFPTHQDKPELIKELVHAIPKELIRDPLQLHEALMQREALCATAMGRGIALPHTLSDSVAQPALIAGVLPESIDWHSSVGMVSRVILMLLPRHAKPTVIEGFVGLTRSLLEPLYCQALCQATHPQVLHAIISLGLRQAGRSP
ncbi:PTS sugar transporter subunit IIA [Dongshaea marina]|uniref:PTS sugar transporter subunit IIA n=1 Tax=Dongshaea marina TaxID=2047966 RepID=UPI00131F08D6|nr:PTS sugar transporter subunit IIA [Dongshaea marina]